MGTLRVRTRVGSVRSQGQISAASHNIPTITQYTDDLFRQGIETHYKQLDLRLAKLEKRMQDAVRSAYIQAIYYAANHMMGTRSMQRQKVADTRFNSKGARNYTSLGQSTKIRIDPRQSWSDPAKGLGVGFKQVGGVGDVRQEVYWNALTTRTLNAKMQAPGERGRQRVGHTRKNRNDARKFFIHTGELRSKLKASARSFANNTGLVRVYFRNKNNRVARASRSRAKIKLGEMSVRLAPRIPVSAWFNDNGAMERRLGASGDVLAKLLGKAKGENGPKDVVQRPMLRPVISFYTYFVIPRRLATVVNATLKKEFSGNNGLGANME